MRKTIHTEWLESAQKSGTFLDPGPHGKGIRKFHDNNTKALKKICHIKTVMVYLLTDLQPCHRNKCLGKYTQ